MAKSKNGATAKKSVDAKIHRDEQHIPVERVQLGVRMEKRMVKVLKAVAEYGDMTLSELLETIVLHSFEGGTAQTFGPEEVKLIAEFKKLYGMDYETHASDRFVEKLART